MLLIWYLLWFKYVHTMFKCIKLPLSGVQNASFCVLGFDKRFTTHFGRSVCIRYLFDVCTCQENVFLKHTWAHVCKYNPTNSFTHKDTAFFYCILTKLSILSIFKVHTFCKYILLIQRSMLIWVQHMFCWPVRLRSIYNILTPTGMDAEFSDAIVEMLCW